MSAWHTFWDFSTLTFNGGPPVSPPLFRPITLASSLSSYRVPTGFSFRAKVANVVEVTRRSFSSATTTTTTPSGHRVGWPCVGGGKPRVSRDYSFRAKPACAVESTSDGNDDDADVLHDSNTTTTSPYPLPTPPPPPPPPPLPPPPRATA